MISAAVRDIWASKGVVPVAKFEDDFAVFRIPSPDGSYSYDREGALDKISHLGVPWHPPEKKGDPIFLDVFTFTGLLWDIPARRVSLPIDKRLKYIHRVQSFLESYTTSSHPRIRTLATRGPISKCPLLAVESVHGTLCYTAFVYRQGSTFLPAISSFAASYRNREIDLGKFPPTSVVTALEWWLDTLLIPNFFRQLSPRGPLSDMGIYADASTDWGIGLWFRGNWAAFRLLPGWKVEGRDICWLETIAIELVAYFLEAAGIHDSFLLIHSDNQGTIGAIRKACSPNRWINLSVRRTYALLSSIAIDPHLVYIESDMNPADPLSRGLLGHRELGLPYCFNLPDELSDVIIRV